MFGISFTELLVVALVAIVVVGPERLPDMLGRVGRFIGKMRRVATDMRRQTGIDDILRAEGLDGGLNELRTLMRTNLSDLGRPGHPPAPPPRFAHDPYGDHVEHDRSREYPVEGPDCYDAIPEDLAGSLDDVFEPGGVEVTEANAAPAVGAPAVASAAIGTPGTPPATEPEANA